MAPNPPASNASRHARSSAVETRQSDSIESLSPRRASDRQTSQTNPNRQSAHREDDKPRYFVPTRGPSRRQLKTPHKAGSNARQSSTPRFRSRRDATPRLPPPLHNTLPDPRSPRRPNR